MKTYADFLYLGNLLAQCPEDNKVVLGAYNKVFRPYVKIVEEDCNRKTGEPVAISSKCVGLVEIYNNTANSTNVPITRFRIKDMFDNQEGRKFYVRSLSSCVSTGGICRRCLHSSYQWIDESFNRSSIQVTSDYPSLSGVPVVGTYFKFDFTGKNSVLLLSHLTKTYNGSLLGMKSYLLDKLPISHTLLNSFLPEQVTSYLLREVSDTELVPTMTLQYVQNISDPLEKTLYILSQYFFNYYTQQ